jgi:glycosyltransferase involved in cell wall biosynthesis
MRILAITNLYPNPFQPTRATFNRQQIRGLAKEHKIAVIAPILWTDELSARMRGKDGLAKDRRWQCDGLPIYHPHYFYPPYVFRRWYGKCFETSIASVFDRVCAEHKPELVFAPWAYPDGWAACELGHRAGLPVVLKLHGSDILTLRRYPERFPPTLEALRRADKIIAVSQDLANHVMALGIEPKRIQVVYDGIDQSLFHPGSQEDARMRLRLNPSGRIILFIGNLVPVKGLEILLEACTRLRQEAQPFDCYLIGEGPLRGKIQSDIQKRDLQNHVRLLGTKPHDELPDWYRAATICVLPSFSEGIPLVLLEAIACRTPFVASRVGGIPEIAHLGTCQLVAPGDAAALAGALRSFLASNGCYVSKTTCAADEKMPPEGPRGDAQAVSELTSIFEETLQSHQARTSRIPQYVNGHIPNGKMINESPRPRN